jgi:hypothetical protein
MTVQIWVGIFVCPFDIFWRSTRRWLAKIMGRVFLAPFYRVTQADFFMADQLSSQVGCTLTLFVNPVLAEAVHGTLILKRRYR